MNSPDCCRYLEMLLFLSDSVSPIAQNILDWHQSLVPKFLTEATFIGSDIEKNWIKEKNWINEWSMSLTTVNMECIRLK